SDERVLPYQRPPLSKDYLDGKIGLDLLLIRPEAFYRDHRIDYLPDTRAVEIDRAARQLCLASGERLGYDHLVLATGARNRVPPLPGIELNGVEFSFGAQAVRIAAKGGRVDHIELVDGERVQADLVLVSIGVVPNGELAAAAGLAVANGIVVDAQLATADPAISAIGDCCAF